MSVPLILVGLGNPGPKYLNTRHNIGFAVIDELANRWKAGPIQEKFHGHICSVERGGRKIFLLKPQTFMNLSGQSVQQVLHFYKASAETDLVVFTDDLDTPEGSLRLRSGGGSGGHNGLKSIIELLGTEAFARVRLGVGRRAEIPADAYVLMKLSTAELPLYSQLAKLGAEAAETIADHSFSKAMNTFNKRQTNES